MDAVTQLASKEKELEELRAMIHEKPIVENEEEKQVALSKIEELNQQLEVTMAKYIVTFYSSETYPVSI